MTTLRQRKRFALSLWPEACIVILWNLAFFLFLFLRLEHHYERFVLIDALAQTLGPLLVLLLCLNRYRLARNTVASANPLHTWSFMLLCAYLVLMTIRSATWAITAISQAAPPTPGWGDIAWFGAYLALLGVITLLSGPRREITSYLRIVLDGLIIMISLVAFSWYFVLGPTIVASSAPALTKITETAYPLFDLLLFYCILSFQSVEAHLKTTVNFLSGALLVLMITDSVFDHQILEESYLPGQLTDIGWSLGPMLFGLASLALLFSLQMPVTSAELPGHGVLEIPRLWRALLPYLLVPLMAGLIISIASQETGNQSLKYGVYILGIILLGIVLLRQIFLLRETVTNARNIIMLNGELLATQQVLAEKNEELSSANQRLESLATTDPLTELPNHRSLVQRVELEIARSRRHKHAFSLLIVDLDHFRTINDSFGYAVGDNLLREFSGILVQTVRTSDVAGRWGGEEFLAILPETNIVAARIAAQRICSAVSNYIFASAGGAHMTCSVGVATYPEDGRERDSLITIAEQTQTVAKQLGRNRFHTTHEAETVPTASAPQQAPAPAPLAQDGDALGGAVEALCKLVDEHNQALKRPSKYQSGYLATKVALELGLDDSQTHLLNLAGRLYDIGKITLPDTLLLKKEPLTEADWALIRQHPQAGANILSSVPPLRALAPMIRSHHERFDGNGYPDHLAGEDIPLGARILAVIDAFSAMTTEHPYKPARSTAEALTELRQHAGTQFDPRVVAIFEQVIAQEQQETANTKRSA